MTSCLNFSISHYIYCMIIYNDIGIIVKLLAVQRFWPCFRWAPPPETEYQTERSNFLDLIHPRMASPSLLSTSPSQGLLFRQSATELSIRLIISELHHKYNCYRF